MKLSLTLSFLATLSYSLKENPLSFLEVSEEDNNKEDRSSEAEEYIDGLVNIVLTTSDDGVDDGLFYKTVEDIEENLYYMRGIDDVIDEDSYVLIMGKENYQDDIDFGIITNEAALDHMTENNIVIAIDYGEAYYLPADQVDTGRETEEADNEQV